MNQKHVTIRTAARTDPELRKLARALIALARLRLAAEQEEQPRSEERSA